MGVRVVFDDSDGDLCCLVSGNFCRGVLTVFTTVIVCNLLELENGIGDLFVYVVGSLPLCLLLIILYIFSQHFTVWMYGFDGNMVLKKRHTCT